MIHVHFNVYNSETFLNLCITLSSLPMFCFVFRQKLFQLLLKDLCFQIKEIEPFKDKHLDDRNEIVSTLFKEENFKCKNVSLFHESLLSVAPEESRDGDTRTVPLLAKVYAGAASCNN